MQSESKNTGTEKCIICDKYISDVKTFACRNCRRSSMCMEHFDREYKVCSGCATEKRIKLYNDLLKQGKGLNGFISLNYFIFLLFAVIFVSKQFFADNIPDFVKENIFVEYYFLWGGIAAIGLIIGHILKFPQKSRIEELDGKIHGHKGYQKSSKY